MLFTYAMNAQQGERSCQYVKGCLCDTFYLFISCSLMLVFSFCSCDFDSLVVCKSMHCYSYSTDRQRKQTVWKENGSYKRTWCKQLHVYLSKSRLASEKKHSSLISPVVWFGMSIFASESFLFLRVWCGVRFAALIMASATKDRCQKKRRDGRHRNLLRALLNKVFKYYPKLKDIHACLKSSPPRLSLSF